jgi:hypothetical protein
MPIYAIVFCDFMKIKNRASRFRCFQQLSQYV